MNACLVSQRGFLRGNPTCTSLFKEATLISAWDDSAGILVLAAALCVKLLLYIWRSFTGVLHALLPASFLYFAFN